MRQFSDPVVVRRPRTIHFTKPGLHRHSATRRLDSKSRRWKAVQLAQFLLLVAGLISIGYYGYTVCDQYVYQAYENWAFDLQIAGHPPVTFTDYIRQQTPFGFLVGARTESKSAPTMTTLNSGTEQVRPAEGSVLGRVAIDRLHLSAVVREGVEADTLRVAVGHVPSTALPGEPGNLAIAAHRDTLFRALKDIRPADEVTFESPSQTYTYRVEATKIVKPSDVSVLRPDGGGLITRQASNGEPGPKSLLTMITCYPFYYVGSAPKRFIVEASFVSAAKHEDEKPPESSVTPVNSNATANSPPGDASVPVHKNRTSKKTRKRHSAHRSSTHQ